MWSTHIHSLESKWSGVEDGGHHGNLDMLFARQTETGRHRLYPNMKKDNNSIVEILLGTMMVMNMYLKGRGRTEPYH